MKRIVLGTIVIATVSWISAVSSCSDDTVSPDEEYIESLRSVRSDPDTVAYLKANFGARLTGIEEAADFKYESDGTIVTSANGVMQIEGKGTANIYIHERIYPQADGGDVELYVEDTDSGENRYFYYDPVDSYVVFARELAEGTNGQKDPEKGAVVARNTDGTYAVWTFDDSVAAGRDTAVQVADGYAALALVNDFAEFNTIPPHIVMTAIAIGYSEVPEGRLPVFCQDTAMRPAVCTIFKEFCDCAACEISGKAGCELCPAR